MTTQVEMTGQQMIDLGEDFVSGLENLTKARAELKNVVTALIALAERDIEESVSRLGYLNKEIPQSSWTFGVYDGEFFIRWGHANVYSHFGKKYSELSRGFVMQARREIGALILGFMREFGFDVAVSQICDAGRE